MVAAVGDELVGGLDDIGPGGRVAVVRAHIVAGRADDRGEHIVGGQRPQNQVGVPRGGDVVGVQPAGVNKRRAGAAHGLSLVVHHGDKVVNAAAAHVVRHDVGGLVAAGQQHGVEQVAQALRLAPADIGRGRVGALLPNQIVDIARGGQADGVELILVIFQQQQRRHQLGQAGGGERRLAVFLVHDDVGVEVDHVGSRGGQRGSIVRKGAAPLFRRDRQCYDQHEHEGK